MLDSPANFSPSTFDSIPYAMPEVKHILKILLIWLDSNSTVLIFYNSGIFPREQPKYNSFQSSKVLPEVQINYS